MNKINFILYRTVAVLLCLVVISFSIVSSQYAKYSTGDNGYSWADLATFNVSITAGDAFENGLNRQYPLAIANASEVSVAFNTVTVQFSEALPENITLGLTDAQGNALCPEQVTDGTSDTFSFTAATALAPQSSKTVLLQITQEEWGVFDAETYTVKASVKIYQTD